MRSCLRPSSIFLALPVALWSAAALAQNIGDTGTSPPSAAAPLPKGGTGPAEPGMPPASAAPAPTVTTVYRPYGLPYPGTNPDAHLPSSSRSVTDASSSSDGFDLGDQGGEGGTVRGNADAAGVTGGRTRGSHLTLRPGSVPDVHRVEKGDTLWALCDQYYSNPWYWPKVWSYNPQIQNPHWIYPGDELHLRSGTGEADVVGDGAGGPGAGDRNRPAARGISGGPLGRSPAVSKGTVFLRSVGYIDDPKKEVWGELIGSQEEQMLLTEGNGVYLKLRPGADVVPGQSLTVFHPVRTPAKVPGARRPPGDIIAFKGTVRISQYNPKTRVAYGKLIESLDTIERGDKVGPVARSFQVVPARQSDADIEAHILTSLYPHEVLGQNQVAFIDRGEKDGVMVGMRFRIVTHGDAWRHTLKTAAPITRERVRTDVPEHVRVEDTPLIGNDKDYPEEVLGELRVLRVDAYSSVTLVTASRREIEPGAVCVAQKGY